MSDGGTSGDWYVRARGRILGPLTWEQLQSLRDRGRLARFHQVSQDCQTWVGADSLERLFPQAEERRPSRLSRSNVPAQGVGEFIVLGDDDAAPPGSTTPTAQESPGWFLARGGAYEGPLRLSELKLMAGRGEIGPETLLWTSGMDQWTPGSQIAELAFPARPAAAATGGTLPPGQGSETPREAMSSPPTSPLAFASLVLGLLWLGGIGSLAAIVLGGMAMHRIAHSNGTLSGKGLAIAGLGLGIAGIVLTLLGLIVTSLLRSFEF
jgi:hypothetical protein